MRQEQSNTTPRQPPKVPRNPSTPQPAGETQSSGAAGETQSSSADGQTRKQDEAHSSGADNENRVDNEEETNNNQDSEGVDEVSRHLDKNCLLKSYSFCCFSTKSDVGTQENRLNETVLLSHQNKCLN